RAALPDGDAASRTAVRDDLLRAGRGVGERHRPALPMDRQGHLLRWNLACHARRAQRSAAPPDRAVQAPEPGTDGPANRPFRTRGLRSDMLDVVADNLALIMFALMFVVIF